jgi:UDPglucose--hexose-1-phosphate uridylyltransferase
MTITNIPHRRLNRLTGEWLLVSPHRTARPWQGMQEAAGREQRPAHDPQCYLCPGNTRAGGAVTPQYDGTFVFDNDYAALLPEIEAQPDLAVPIEQAPLLTAVAERGICRVICFSPRHDLSMAEMAVPEIRRVVDTWADQTIDLAAIPWVRSVQIFENRGTQMGASNPHPHGQIWANERLPNEPLKELVQQRAYHEHNGRCLLCDYLAEELRLGERIIAENDAAVALVPFWAVWPFETMLLPRRHVGGLPQTDSAQRDGIAALLRQLTRGYDALFDISFPYSMGWHQQPVNSGDEAGWHLHAHFYPPLLRSATIRKHMVGYEMFGQPQRDFTPEAAAVRLRALMQEHV